MRHEGRKRNASREHSVAVASASKQKLRNDEVHDTHMTREDESDTSSSESDREEDLRARLLASMQTSQFEKTPNRYLPRDKFKEIFCTRSKPREARNLAIFERMGVNSAAPTSDDISLTNYILEHCRVLYLIGVFIELESKQLRTVMSMFKKEEFIDERLPIDMWTMKRLKSGIKKHPFHPFVEMERRHEAARTTRVWDLSSLEKFQSEQWKFLTPTISTSEIFHDFHQYTVPFVAKHNFVGKGGNGIVHKYEIHRAHFEHASHHSKPNGSSRASSENGIISNVVAVKEIRKEGNEVARRWEREVRALARMNGFDHPHIVRFITSFRRRGTSNDIEHYVMFEWADGGNLSDFRAAHPNPEMTAELIKWVIQQLCGLAQALSKAHYLEDDGSYRHGDLKPANILWFRKGDTKYGTLKIGDWGEAKEHYNGTALRNDTTAQYGTRRYEPPEVQTGLRLKLSGESRFGEYRDYGVSDMFYEVSLGKPAKVHAVAEHWMKQMAMDPRCSRHKTALGDLLEIVRTGLLIVKLPPDGGAKRPHLHPDHILGKQTLDSSKSGPSISTAKILDTGRDNDISIQVTQELVDPTLANPGEPMRCLATDFEEYLEKILANDQNESYWFTRHASRPPPVESRRLDLLSVETGAIALTRDAPSHWYNGVEQRDYGTKNPADLENWIFDHDNEFAQSIFSRLGEAGVLSSRAAPVSSTLCDNCMAIRKDLLSPYFERTYQVAELRRMARKATCDLCDLLWTTYEKFCSTTTTKVRFRRQGSMITMGLHRPPVLTLLQNNVPQSRAVDVQIGLPDLQPPGEAAHLEILRGWLDNCDQFHRCKPTKTTTRRAPTRLIDVGSHGDDVVYLREVGLSTSDDWVALSYRWGPTPHFSTTIETRESHLAGMQLKHLPRTFRDAVKITRSLRKRYLWIDSLCIIQGEGGDFSDEAKRMEDVYSGAYCVLAASCATDQRSGFLLPRRKARKYVALKASNDSDSIFYVCERIEDFRKHVLEGDLCRRGWVFQEHALARRTIFFTEHQTYWECGQGIRCQSLAKMRNDSAAFLGDPEFPKLLNPSTADKGKQIYHSQELYRQFSRLEFSMDHDRPAAIDGLQMRLLRTMNVEGRFGIFDDPNNARNKGFLRRSLLWRRGSEVSTLQRIKFGEDREAVPSWSWMAVAGGIDYFHPQFTGFDWQDVTPPWSCSVQAGEEQLIKAQARSFILPVADSEEHQFIFDEIERPKQDQSKVIVLGIAKIPKDIAERRHFVLLVEMMAECTPDGHKYCKRVGAGYLPGKLLAGEVTLCALI